MKIGKIKIKNPLFLAPMAGITDQPFRLICREMGAGVVYTEFVSSNGIIRENMRTLNLMKFLENERPIGIQIFGEDPKVVGKSAKMINDMFKPDIIDINYGCPVPKVTKKGAGSAALKDLCLMEETTDAVINSVPNTPVTIKMRAGWDSNNIVSTDAGIKMEKLGVAAITLHARTTKQKFSGKSDWSLIKELKENINIPVIGNGDISTYQDYLDIKKYTNCDGIMIGRAALGNPWIFKNILNKNNNMKNDINFYDVLSVSRQHLLLMEEFYPSHICLNHTKKHFSWYFKGFNGAAKLRKAIMLAQDLLSVKAILNNIIKNYSEDNIL